MNLKNCCWTFAYFASFLVALPLLFIATGLAFGDDNEYSSQRHTESFSSSDWWQEMRYDVAAVSNELYREECGSCHFSYQPGLLPERSWRKLMTSLAEHFGEDASIDESLNRELLAYLVDNSAERSGYKRSRKINASLAGETPLRISDTLYFKRHHYEVPMHLVQDNSAVGSLSNCGGCHNRAESGSYDEDEVVIAGFGRWDD